MRNALIPVLLLTTLAAGAQSYHEPFRPQFHFSPREHWTNDPNGLVYFEGEYHLFFQYNPFGDVWGHMSWGHAVSRDLVHWTELPVALPEEKGVMIFTGSAVVDQHNTSGFCKGGKPCLVAVYTGYTAEAGSKPSLQTQNLAYSNDRGRTWTKYSKNPVLDLHMTDFRDPKVLWSSEAKHWVMAVSLPNDHKIRFYGSPNLRDWKPLSDFGPEGAVGGQWECPELFALPVDGKPANTRWVLKVGLNPGGLAGGSGEQYFIGRFDGSRFINDNPAPLTLWTDYGKDCYCGLTFSNLPPGQKQVMIGWMSNWQYAAKVPTHPWRGQMTVPRELSLRTTPDGIRLYQNPSAALQALRQPFAKGQTTELESTLQFGAAKKVGWKVLADDGTYTLIGYDRDRQQLFTDRTKSGQVAFNKDFPARTTAPLTVSGKQVQLRLLIDQSSVEVFAEDGRLTMTSLVYPNPGATRVEPYAEGGKAGPVTSKMWSLRSIWP